MFLASTVPFQYSETSWVDRLTHLSEHAAAGPDVPATVNAPAQRADHTRRPMMMPRLHETCVTALGERRTEERAEMFLVETSCCRGKAGKTLPVG